MLTVNLHLAGSTYCEGQELIHREMEKGHTLQPESLYLVRDSHKPVDANAVHIWYGDNGKKIRLGFVQKDQAPEVSLCMDDSGELAVINIAVSGAKETNFSMNFHVQMSHPSDFEKPDINSHPDYSIFDGHENFPFEMADEYVAGEGPSDYDNYVQDDDDPIEEPPYMDIPDIPERV